MRWMTWLAMMLLLPAGQCMSGSKVPPSVEAHCSGTFQDRKDLSQALLQNEVPDDVILPASRLVLKDDRFCNT